MNLQLENKLALVSGSTAGIGFAIAKALAAEGLASSSMDVPRRVEGRPSCPFVRVPSETRSPRPRPIQSGCGNGDHKALSRDGHSREQPGCIYPRPFEEITDAEWSAIIETNFISGVRLSRYYLARMKAAGWGRIIFISSESAVNIPVEMIHYGVTKTMQVALARGLAETTAGTAVTVNWVLAGTIRSEGVENSSLTSRKRKMPPAEVEKEFFNTARHSPLLSASPRQISCGIRRVRGQPSLILY